MGLDRRLTAGLLGTAMQVVAAAAWAQAPAPSGDLVDKAEVRRDPFKAFDITGDGNLDVAEAKRAGAVRYDELNPSFDERLDRRGAAAVLPGDEFDRADANRDGVVNKAEYLAVVERRHVAADADKDQKLSRTEFDSAAGQRMLGLLR